MMAPERVLEYVVVHELVHLEHPNHTDRFWQRVHDLYPDYRQRRTWLRENDYKLVFEEDPR